MQPITENLWHVTSVFCTGPVHFPTRMTVIRLDDGSLLLHMPVAIDDDLARAIDALGPVRHIVEPCLLHNAHAGAAKGRWPDATLWAPPGMAARVPDVPWDAVLDADASFPGLRVHPIEGIPKINEVVFLHEASRTLIVCDLVFNLREVTGWASPWVFRLAGTWGRFAQSRLFKSMVSRRGPYAESLAPVLAWDFDRIVLNHGDIVPTGGKELLRGATAWAMPA